MATQTVEKEFNLLYEPWIVVKTKSNETKKWSLLEVFKHAHEVEQLAGELPTQDIAILRLLLAIMHATFVDENVEDAEDALKLWSELWDLKQFPYDLLETYLEQYAERFWLFHPSTPFYQVADLVKALNQFRAAKGKKVKDEENVKSVARLIGDLFQSANAKRLFAGRTGTQQDVLSYDEAARWLLHLNGFDDDAAKNPTPKGVGYLGQLGLIYAQGNNLFETLMLNFILVDNRGELFNDVQEKSKAYWEKPVCTTVENIINQPNAQKDLLTMQSRRILLKREHGQVVGYYLTMGDYFAKDQPLLNEQMTLWKSDEKIGFVPKRHLPERQMWRDLASILSTNNLETNALDSGIVTWLRLLQAQKLFASSFVKLCIVGIYYKPKGAGWQLIDFVDDSLQFNASILGHFGENWIEAVKRVLAATDAAMVSLGWLAVDIMEAEGNSGDKAQNASLKHIRASVREKGYHQLDKAFRNWLVSIDPQKDKIEDRSLEWQQCAKKIIFTEGEGLMDKCSDKALVGYIKKEKDKETNVNAFAAFTKFRAGVTKVLG